MINYAETVFKYEQAMMLCNFIFKGSLISKKINHKGYFKTATANIFKKEFCSFYSKSIFISIFLFINIEVLAEIISFL
jgi:hypothetical protein